MANCVIPNFLLREIDDKYVRENFYKLKLYLECITGQGGDLTGPAGPPGPQGPAGAPGVDGTGYIILENVTCDASVFLGAVVRMTSGGSAVNALADSMANSNMMGIAVAKASPTLADIQVSGITSTIFAGLDVTKDYFLSPTTPGAITITPPSGAGEVLVKVGRPFSATRLLILNNLRQRRL